jgi:hypothetical protein
MLSANALGTVISLARGIVKLAGRLDVLMAERAGVEGPLVIPTPVMTFPKVALLQQVTALEKYLNETAEVVPDPLGTQRTALTAAVAGRTDEVDTFFLQIFPERAGTAIVDPDQDFIKALRVRLPDLDLDNPDIRLAAFYLTAGKDARGIGYVTRTALLVADVVAEFGVEHASQFISHQPTRDLVASIVGRFAKPELESFTEWGPLLRHALASALEGLVENKAAIEGSVPWLDAVLSAVAAAQEDPAGGTDFVTGLVNGKGYQLLFSKGLLLAAERLAPEGAGPYKDIAADVLRGAAPLVKAHSASFRTFFNDNWGELLRAGLNSVDKHGPVLLEGEKPLLRDVTLALVKELAEQPDLTRLSRETVFNLTDAAIGVAAKNPKLLTGDSAKPWVKEFIAAALKAVGDQGVRKILGSEGVEQVLLKALGVLREHPELLVDKPGARIELVGSVLKAVSAAGGLDARTLGTAAVTGILERLASNPNLARTRYPEIVSALASDLAKHVAAKTLTGVQASDVLHSAAEAILRNPALFEKLEGKVATAVVSGVVKGAGTAKTSLVAGATLVAVLDEVLQAVARRGRPLLDKATDGEALAAKLTATIKAGLERAEADLGRGLDGSDLPRVLAALVAAVARGEITELDPNSPKFQQAFVGLVEAFA